ncbi:MAG: AAA family ATPase [Lewinellaceae bacterium]|nr:AAA family ATPase [Saprospiraceae bacterium]MCB9340897.1 AAA family ATPase [Lewinellaceae bacterium]
MASIERVPDFRKFKFRELKTYSSTEWLADNRKKYRQVFDRWETTYVYAELSFYNKYFDKEDWDVEVELKCFAIKKAKKELCTLPFHRKVSKFDNIVYIREGWGNKAEGVFWKKGTYVWEAFIEGEKVASRYFYVEDAGQDALKRGNPYIQLYSLKLYEGPYDDVMEDDRTYYRKFNGSDTRYIYAEILLKNIHFDKLWQCELFVKFYNDARELKGQVVRLQKIERKDEYLKISAGWGSNVKGSWRKDKYTCELVFMDKMVAAIPFEVGDFAEEGVPPIYIPDKAGPVIFTPMDDMNESFAEVMVKLDALVGLSEIKEKVRDHAKYIQFLQIRKDAGFEEKDSINVHSVFIGNPGTGKTTVATMMGRLYRKMGLLSRGHVHVVDRVDLVGEYIGQTAPKVKDAIERARGGVLFIDEAYALARNPDDTKDFGREVIEILVKEMSDGPGDLAVIAAGYPKEMNKFLDSNPGLKSRFAHYYEFSDYLPQELSLIAGYACQEKEIKLSAAAKAKIDDIIVNAYRDRDRSFGNARFVYDLLDKAKIYMGLRIMEMEEPSKLDREILETVQEADVAKIDYKPSRELPHIPIDEELLHESISELNHLIGLDKVKDQIIEHVRLVRYYRETSRDVLNSFFLHTVLIGNPGTGKTTVARILTKIYKALGILERGHMVETDRQGLVAGFVGQTATKTAEKIDEAMGGVLFIDEAYSLTQKSGGNDFGDEAIQTILKRMEDNRGRFFIFVAGYPDNMESFMKANPGLSSRFDKVLKFDDYSSHELLRIALQMLEEKGIVPAPEAEEHLAAYFDFLYNYRDKFFGNARTVRQVVIEAIKNQNLRLASFTPDERENVSANILILEDVVNFKLDTSGFIFNKKGIGFRRGGD